MNKTLIMTGVVVLVALVVYDMFVRKLVVKSTYDDEFYDDDDEE